METEAETKFCKHCQCEHPLTTEFWTSGGKDCKEYKREYQKANADKIKEYYKANADKTKEYNKEYYKANADKLKEHKKEYRKANADKIKEYCKEHYKANADKLKEHQKEYYKSNADKAKEYNKEYRKDNADNIKKNKKEYQKANADKISKRAKGRYQTDINVKLAQLLRGRLRKAIKNDQKTGSAVRDLGCTIDELKQHLESKFQEGMSWENHGLYGWHIDHIIPLASFDLTDREQLLKACHYTNLRPLWAEENLAKGDKIPTDEKEQP